MHTPNRRSHKPKWAVQEVGCSSQASIPALETGSAIDAILSLLCRCSGLWETIGSWRAGEQSDVRWYSSWFPSVSDDRAMSTSQGSPVQLGRRISRSYTLYLDAYHHIKVFASHSSVEEPPAAREAYVTIFRDTSTIYWLALVIWPKATRCGDWHKKVNLCSSIQA